MVNHPKFFGWESFGMVRFDLWTPSSWSNEDIAFIVVGKLFIDIADIYCFGTGLPISRSKHVFQYHHFK